MKNRSTKKQTTLLPGIFLKKIMLNFVNLLAAKVVKQVFIPPVKVSIFFSFYTQNIPCYSYYLIYYIKNIYYNNIRGGDIYKGDIILHTREELFSPEHPEVFGSRIFGGIIGVPKGNRAKYLGEGRDCLAFYWKAFRKGNRALMEWVLRRWENRLAVLLQPGGDKTPPMLIRRDGESQKEWLDRCYAAWRD